MAYHYWIWYQGRPVRGGLVSLRAPADRCDAQSVIEAIELQTEISIAGVGVGGTVDAVDGWNLAPDPYGDHGRGAADRLGWADLPPRYPHDRPSVRDPEAVRRPVREGNRDHDHDRDSDRDSERDHDRAQDHVRDRDSDRDRDRDRSQDPVLDHDQNALTIHLPPETRRPCAAPSETTSEPTTETPTATAIEAPLFGHAPQFMRPFDHH